MAWSCAKDEGGLGSVTLKGLHTNPDGNYKPGIPKIRQRDAIESDLKVLRVIYRKTLARNRSDKRRPKLINGCRTRLLNRLEWVTENREPIYFRSVQDDS